jgi:pyruvate,water dikinase
MLTHAAIAAREYGIPAVVGTWNATNSIRDGDIIRVNGTAGVVQVLQRADGTG